ncbi:MarR family winged helix-turn-helix transcriptional regulator [Spirochaetota bacterium]
MKSLSEKIIEFYEKLSSWEHSIVEGSGLSLPQVHTIEILGMYKNLRMKELALKMGVTTGTLTVTIDKLEKINLVKRVPNPNDRRSYVIELTKKGKEYHVQHSNYHLELTKECTRDFSKKDVEIFSKLLNEFLKNL